MDTAVNSMTPPSLASRKLGDLSDLVATVRNLNECLFMASSDIGDRDKTNALQSVGNEIAERLLVIEERIDELREEVR